MVLCLRIVLAVPQPARAAALSAAAAALLATGEVELRWSGPKCCRCNYSAEEVGGSKTAMWDSQALNGLLARQVATAQLQSVGLRMPLLLAWKVAHCPCVPIVELTLAFILCCHPKRHVIFCAP
jgi:hypothetical protein